MSHFSLPALFDWHNHPSLDYIVSQCYSFEEYDSNEAIESFIIDNSFRAKRGQVDLYFWANLSEFSIDINRKDISPAVFVDISGHAAILNDKAKSIFIDEFPAICLNSSNFYWCEQHIEELFQFYFAVCRKMKAPNPVFSVDSLTIYLNGLKERGIYGCDELYLVDWEFVETYNSYIRNELSKIVDHSRIQDKDLPFIISNMYMGEKLYNEKIVPFGDSIKKLYPYSSFGIKVFLDGVIENGTACFSQYPKHIPFVPDQYDPLPPISKQPSLSISCKEILRIIDKCLTNSIPLSVHCIGNGASSVFVSCVEAIYSKSAHSLREKVFLSVQNIHNPKFSPKQRFIMKFKELSSTISHLGVDYSPPPLLRMEHCMFVSPVDAWHIMMDLGIVMCMQPNFSHDASRMRERERKIIQEKGEKEISAALPEKVKSSDLESPQQKYTPKSRGFVPSFRECNPIGDIIRHCIKRRKETIGKSDSHYLDTIEQIPLIFGTDGMPLGAISFVSGALCPPLESQKFSIEDLVIGTGSNPKDIIIYDSTSDSTSSRPEQTMFEVVDESVWEIK
ncbi:hypothetical protein ADUPG1_009315 [Aduncisulcus paluster]|uniref:Amidohydrolase 3 domain-containing protein n=1 Tax=Aduncisulcus paluster TaxID=2918883 RepID=A0ABQ5KWD2_9EUKA|nr:hypothetical protein ADUPG1_009315 [Aduncisulcus paluster]|eukprot:gnl/Carplike_NY0171/3851_a5194_323.p1 GENE.gnl/Carplike_NY0171/3851_a5194_323~~gnl/Carplike_NY0171/3851_a5194_323.p1  ORF type:complete len:562 (+),score=81.43 gnl/Carplike_NY0171/3851_a5194_323:55-1740(+)